ncbi:MAG: leucine dehydrogenase [Chlamydiae bacterium]|nr:leucine dehydrogenase [Chlamydiota bacterium]
MTTLKAESLVIEEIPTSGYQKILKITDDQVGLKAIICLHDLTLGPALGGTRIRFYSFEDALQDVKRLAKGMTYKSVLAGCSWGGGKSVIIAKQEQKSRELFHAFGQAINTLKGTYICAEDSGCFLEDIESIRQSTPYVVGAPHEKSSGNPSPFTAWGIYRGIQAVLKSLYQSDSVEGKVVAIQGVGSVGERLAEILFWRGAKLIISDIDREKASRLSKLYGAKLVGIDEIFSMPCDIFSPCALGGSINRETIKKLRCQAVAGCANNQLLEENDGEELAKRNILYAPDFVINAGGLINVTHETIQEGYHPLKARNHVDKIYDQLNLIFDIAKKRGCSPQKAALNLADYRLKNGIGKREDPIYLHHSNHSYSFLF